MGYVAVNELRTAMIIDSPQIRQQQNMTTFFVQIYKNTKYYFFLVFCIDIVLFW
jgi:hypothetical protein